MGYALHIERLPRSTEGEPAPIPLDDWRIAVASTEGVRPCPQADHEIINPETGQSITFPWRDGDTEVYLSDEQEWVFAFRWSKRSVTFSPPDADWQVDTSHPVWKAAVALAGYLRAVICGDGGETYDPETGEVSRDWS